VGFALLEVISPILDIFTPNFFEMFLMILDLLELAVNKI
jgi:hypothetical protein